MLKLHLLGSVDLLDAGRDVTPVLRRPKSLALLAYLACARPRGFHRRDALLALFWPDLDQAHARNALRQTVHSLRHVLGAEAVVGRGEEELSVERSRVWCDVPQFEELVDASNAESAVALYRGELLYGFHMSGSGEFEQWLDQERKHLAQRALAATLDLSKEAEKTGDDVAAASWAKRAIEIRPYDESALRRLLRLLDHVGRRADAVREYEDFADRLALDLDVAPSPETRALMETIRARVEPQVFVSAGDLLPRPSPVAAERGRVHPDVVPAAADTVRFPWRRNGLLAFALLLLLVIGAWATGIPGVLWARYEGIPQLRARVAAGDWERADLLAAQLEATLPHDSRVAALRAAFTDTVRIEGSPAGARVYRQSYTAPGRNGNSSASLQWRGSWCSGCRWFPDSGSRRPATPPAWTSGRRRPRDSKPCSGSLSRGRASRRRVWCWSWAAMSRRGFRSSIFAIVRSCRTSTSPAWR